MTKWKRVVLIQDMGDSGMDIELNPDTFALCIRDGKEQIKIQLSSMNEVCVSGGHKGIVVRPVSGNIIIVDSVRE